MRNGPPGGGGTSTAEAARQIDGLRFASTEDREAIIGLVIDAAEEVSLRLTPPELASSPAVFHRPDGTSVFRPKHSTVFSSRVAVGSRRSPPRALSLHDRADRAACDRRADHREAGSEGAQAWRRPGRGVGRRSRSRAASSMSSLARLVQARPPP